MKVYKTINFLFADDEISIVQRFVDLLDGLGDDEEEWNELNVKVTNMDALYAKAAELLDYMNDHAEQDY